MPDSIVTLYNANNIYWTERIVTAPNLDHEGENMAFQHSSCPESLCSKRYSRAVVWFKWFANPVLSFRFFENREKKELIATLYKAAVQPTWKALEFISN